MSIFQSETAVVFLPVAKRGLPENQISLARVLVLNLLNGELDSLKLRSEMKSLNVKL